MKKNSLHQKVVITNNIEEINSILEDGSYMIQMAIPIPIQNTVKFDGQNAYGELDGNRICYILINNIKNIKQ